MKEFIEETLKDLFKPKPYPVCICNNFEEGQELADKGMVVCKNCGGYMSFKRLASMPLNPADKDLGKPV